MKKFLILIVLVLSACVREVKNEWMQIQQVLNRADVMTIGKLGMDNQEKVLRNISDIIVELQSLTFQECDLERLKNQKIKYYQIIFQLLMISENDELYQQLQQQLLDISQQNYQLEKHLEEKYAIGQ